MPNNKKKLNINEFLKLPIKKQEEIMTEIAGKANKDQRDLVRRYDRQFGKAEAAGGC